MSFAAPRSTPRRNILEELEAQEGKLLLIVLCFANKISVSFFRHFTVDYEVVHVNLERPEKNHGFLIVPFVNVKTDEHVHNGFQILIDGDLRDYYDDKYKADLVGSHQILIKMPSVSRTYLEDFDLVYEALGSENVPQIELAHEILRNALKDKKERQERHVLLQFPKSIDPGLCTKHYKADTASQTELDCDYVDIMPKFACPYDGKNTKEQLACFVFWRVTLDELEQRVVVGRSASKLETKAAKKMAKRMQGMSLSST